MILLQTLLAFAVVLGVLIVVHELGHYLAARWCGVKVLRFSVGMGKVIWSRRLGVDQTEWALSILPLGGYVKMLDVRESDGVPIPMEDMKREFTSQSVWRRIVIVAAGPVSNFLFAILVFAALYVHGTPEPAPKLRAPAEQSVAWQAGLRGGERVQKVNGQTVRVWNELRWTLMQSVIDRHAATLEVVPPEVTGAPYTVTLPVDSIATKDLEGNFLGKLGLDVARPLPVLGKIMPDGAGERAGLKEGDVILAIDGRPVPDGLAFLEMIRSAPALELRVDLQRNGQPLSLRLTPERVEQDGQVIGRIRVEVPMMPEMVSEGAPPLSALAKGVVKTWDTSVMTLKMVGQMIVGKVSWRNVSGPITIADYAGQTVRIGLVSYLSFIAFVSISLGVMNLLPIPVLDGGHLLYYAIEILTGRPVSERVGEIAQRAGLGVLLVLMLIAVFNDINRLVS